ncbi:MAG: hypothetical protein K5930_10490 [Treponemataceae bacterium]|nr:hypothetical protein [Treponemataceae bacterium]
MENSGNDITEAVRKLTEKLRRFKNSEPEGIRTEPLRKESIIQQKIKETEESMRKKTAGIYRGYMSPLDTFGPDSQRASAVLRDTDELLKAYKLYKAVMEASKPLSDNDVYLSHIEIETPLSKNESYTTGGMFIYLQLWLIFEQCVEDYIPVMVQEQGGRYHLSFESLQSHYFSSQEKELLASVKNTFYLIKKV